MKYNTVTKDCKKSNKQKCGQHIPSPAKTRQKCARNHHQDQNSLLFLLDSPPNCIKVSFTHIEPHLNCETSRFWIDLSFENTYMLNGCSLLGKNTSISKHIITISYVDRDISKPPVSTLIWLRIRTGGMCL